jgi:hypothetical protein
MWILTDISLTGSRTAVLATIKSYSTITGQRLTVVAEQEQFRNHCISRNHDVIQPSLEEQI